MTGHSPDDKPEPTALHLRIHDAVRRVPAGRVATYGQIAKLVGGCGPRQVGTALARLRAGTDVPWQRIVNAQGRIAARGDGGSGTSQRSRLQAEGVVFDRRERIDLSRFGIEAEELVWLDPGSVFLGDED